MGVNPIEVQKHFEGINYRASKEDLVERLRSLPEGEYTGPDDGQKALKKS